MLKVMQDLTLTPAQLAQRRVRKHLLLLQGDLLYHVDEASKLRGMLDRLRIDDSQYVSHSKHSRQETEATDEV